MMNSGFDDDFSPNPFRTGGGGGGGGGGTNDFLGTPNPQPQQQQMMYGNQQQQQMPPYNAQQQNPTMMQQQQPQQQQQYHPQQQQQMQQPYVQQQQADPNSGMIGNYQMPPPPVQVAPPNPAHYLSGTMDHGAPSIAQRPNNNNYGATGNIPSTPFSIFSWRGLLSCMRLDTYAQYFDVDTVDIADRLKASVFKFYQPDLFRTEVIGDDTIIIQPAMGDPNAPHDPTASMPPPISPTSANNNGSTSSKKGPDLYGPLWISMTLIFVLGATSNLSAYFHHQRYAKKAAAAAGEGESVTIDEFEYDITHLIRAGSIVMIFCFIVPTTFWILTHCLGMPGVSWAMWMTCYGYSAVPILIGALISWWFPYSLWHWIVLAIATSASGMLVVRNLSTPLLSQDSSNHAKAAPVILAILGTHFVYLCILKFSFFTHKY